MWSYVYCTSHVCVCVQMNVLWVGAVTCALPTCLWHAATNDPFVIVSGQTLKITAAVLSTQRTPAAVAFQQCAHGIGFFKFVLFHSLVFVPLLSINGFAARSSIPPPGDNHRVIPFSTWLIWITCPMMHLQMLMAWLFFLHVHVKLGLHTWIQRGNWHTIIQCLPKLNICHFS